MTHTGIVRDDRYMQHVANGYHPESPERLRIIYQMLQDEDMAGRFLTFSPRPATTEELAWVHTSRHIQTIAATAGNRLTMLDPDTYACAQSFDIAKLAAGGVLVAVDKVLAGEVQNAFAFIRPPGHHAEANRAMGFCLFNNVAIAANYCIKIHKLQKILIIDWDLHHGNGTQHSFYERGDVLYFSTHQYPYYPGTGHITEVGSGAGKGFTVNVPLPTGPGDGEYFFIFEEILEPIAQEYKPDIVFVSAGFDIYYQDPLGGMQVTPSGFANLCRIILDLAADTCHGRVILVLEGGYHLQGLREATKAVLKTMRGDMLAQGRDEQMRQHIDHKLIDSIIKKVKETHKPYWKNI